MKVLVTSKSFGKVAPDAIETLRSQGFEVVSGSKPNMTAHDIAAEIAGFDALIVGNDSVTDEVFAAADRLKIVHMHGTGVDAIDINSASEHGVLVANAPGANCNAVAELSVGLMLVAARSIDQHIDILRAGEWKRTPGNELSHKTLGMIGLGAIGRRVVNLLSGFEMDVVGFDIKPDAGWASGNNVSLASNPDEVFARADFLVLALSLNDKTHHFVDARRIGLMKQSAFLINTARGGLVDVSALCSALNEGRIKGAAIDVFDPEPLEPDSILRQTNATLTPHLAATSVESAGNVSRIVARNLIDVLVKKNFSSAINLAMLQRKTVQ